MVYRNLCECERIGDHNLIRIAEMIYNTDPYIYPCLFRCKEDALRLLPKVILRGDDQMFRLSNFYIAEDHGITVGMILWHKGPLNWDARPLCETAAAEGISLSPHLPLVQKQYFEAYKEVPLNTISLVNVSVSPQCQRRGIGTRLLKSFVSEHMGEKMELYVLADNTPARKMYQSIGFQTIHVSQGFSSDNRELPCLQMELN